jgi:hypothetical protein
MNRSLDLKYMLENAQTQCHDVYMGSLCNTWHISTAMSLQCNYVQSLLLITDLHFGDESKSSGMRRACHVARMWEMRNCVQDFGVEAQGKAN